MVCVNHQYMVGISICFPYEFLEFTRLKEKLASEVTFGIRLCRAGSHAQSKLAHVVNPMP